MQTYRRRVISAVDFYSHLYIRNKYVIIKKTLGSKQMIIDFHTHTFPDKIADKTIDMLAKRAGIKAWRRGTLDSLKESMKLGGVDISVVLPVATSPSQVKTINRISAELNGKDGVYFAGAVHPDCENADEILDEVKNAGLFGIKIHPDYQEVRFNDSRYVNIMKKAAERGLYTVTHAGVDLGCPGDVMCTPDNVLDVLCKLEGIIDNKLILAHMGGFLMADEVLEKLCEKPVFLDTAFALDRYPEKCVEIIKRHGADKVLFATDSPWAPQKEYKELFDALPLTKDEKLLVFEKNARKILKI